MKTKKQIQKHMVNIHLMGNGDGLVDKSAHCGLPLDPWNLWKQDAIVYVCNSSQCMVTEKVEIGELSGNLWTSSSGIQSIATEK